MGVWECIGRADGTRDDGERRRKWFERRGCGDVLAESSLGRAGDQEYEQGLQTFFIVGQDRVMG